jgi:preprotein translocase subunit SecF
MPSSLRVIRILVTVIGLLVIMPERLKGIVFCLFVGLLVGFSFLMLAAVNAILRARDHREHKK